MYDCINTKYEDAKHHLSFFSAIPAIFYLKKQIKSGNDTAENYAYLAKAYENLSMHKKALYYAHKAIKKDKKYIYGHLIAAGACHELKKKTSGQRHLRTAEKLGNHWHLQTLKYVFYDNDDKLFSLNMYKCYIELQSYNYDFPEYKAILSILYIVATRTIDLALVKDFFESCKKYRKYEPFDLFIAIVVFLATVCALSLFYSMRDAKQQIIDLIDDLYEEEYELLENFCKEVLHKHHNKKIASHAYLYLGIIRLDKKDYNGSLKYLNRSLLLTKNVVNCYFKAISLWNLSKHEEALKWIDKAEKFDKNRFRYNLARAQIYLALEDYSNAIKAINESALAKQDKDSYFIKGVIYNNMKEYEKALKALKKANELKENDADVLDGLSKCCYALEDYNSALEYVNQLLHIKKSAEALNLKSEILYALGRNAEAEHYKQEAEKLEQTENKA